MNVELVVFDWSGTVSDDTKPVYEAGMQMLKSFDRDIIPFDKWLASSAGSAAEFLKSHGIEEDAKILSAMYENYLDEIVAGGVNPKMYPDAFDVFQYLITKGKKIAVLSTHPIKHIMREANLYNLSQFISSVIGGSADKSVDLVNLCNKFNVNPQNALFIGDTIHDIKAAKRAGVVSIAVTTGYHTKDALLAQKPDYAFSNLSDLKTII